MPVIEVHLLEGYQPAEQQRLAEALTDASRLVVPALSDPCELVNRFAEHLGARNLDEPGRTSGTIWTKCICAIQRKRRNGY